MAQIKMMGPAADAVAGSLAQFQQGHQMALAAEENDRKRAESQRIAQLFVEQLRGARLGNQRTEAQIGYDAAGEGRAAAQEDRASKLFTPALEAAKQNVTKGALDIAGAKQDQEHQEKLFPGQLDAQTNANNAATFKLEQDKKKAEGQRSAGDWLGRYMRGEGQVDENGEDLTMEEIRAGMGAAMEGLPLDDQLKLAEFVQDADLRDQAMQALEATQQTLQFQAGGGFGDGNDLLSADEAAQASEMFNQLQQGLQSSPGLGSTRQLLSDVRTGQRNVAKLMQARANYKVQFEGTAKMRADAAMELSDENIAALAAKGITIDPRSLEQASAFARGVFAEPMPAEKRQAAWREMIAIMYDIPTAPKGSSSLRARTAPAPSAPAAIGGQPAAPAAAPNTARGLLGEIESAASAKLAGDPAEQPAAAPGADEKAALSERAQKAADTIAAPSTKSAAPKPKPDSAPTDPKARGAVADLYSRAKDMTVEEVEAEIARFEAAGVKIADKGGIGAVGKDKLRADAGATAKAAAERAAWSRLMDMSRQARGGTVDADTLDAAIRDYEAKHGALKGKQKQILRGERL